MVLDFTEDNRSELNGLFSFIGAKKRASTAQAGIDNTIEDIKQENGFNDLMFMKPEQAAKSLNIMVDAFAYHEAFHKSKAASYKTSGSISGANTSAAKFSTASADVLSQFRQYALGMDGEVEKLGNSNKKKDGFSYSAPFYKLRLPVKVINTTPVDAVSKADLLSVFKQQSPVAAPVAKKDNTMLIVGGSVLGLLLLGTTIYVIKTKKEK